MYKVSRSLTAAWPDFRFEYLKFTKFRNFVTISGSDPISGIRPDFGYPTRSRVPGKFRVPDWISDTRKFRVPDSISGPDSISDTRKFRVPEVYKLSGPDPIPKKNPAPTRSAGTRNFGLPAHP